MYFMIQLAILAAAVSAVALWPSGLTVVLLFAAPFGIATLDRCA